MGELPQNPTGTDAGAAAGAGPDAATDDWPDEQVDEPETGAMPGPAGAPEDGEDFVDPEGGRPGGP